MFLRIQVYQDGNFFFHLEAALSQIAFKIILGRHRNKFMEKKNQIVNILILDGLFKAILSAELIAFCFFTLFFKAAFINTLR